MPEPPIRVHELESCASTQDELRTFAEAGAPAFTAVRADVQHAGRGRRGRRWEAPAGTALLVSILLRPKRPPHELPALSLAGGVAAVECARAFGAGAGLSWPNDVVCGERKLGGVLAELGPGGSVLLGVGMNLAARTTDLPAADRLAPTSLLLETGSAPAAPVALTALLEALRPLAVLFDAEGPPAIAARARALDALEGAAVELRLASGAVVQGTAAGIADDGCLLVRTDDRVQAYASGEVVRLR
jgi:BirA family transcriptional regulator, biotin operon repressor / biotin---[acetyl-CoA-carboxylase] ligase